MLRDSMQIKKQLLKDLDPERAKIVRKSIAKFFDNDDDDADPAVLKTELMQTWSGVKIPKMSMPSIRNPFNLTSNDTGGGPTETSNLV